ncbi:hypothetical protein AB0K49_37285 [Streptomyces decoyicus]
MTPQCPQGLDLVGELLDSVGQQAQGDTGDLRSDRLFVARRGR